MPKRLRPKRLGAETASGRNVLVPCYPTLLIIIALSYRKSIAEVLGRRLINVTQCWLFPLTEPVHREADGNVFFFFGLEIGFNGGHSHMT